MLLSLWVACLAKVPNYLLDPVQYPHAQCPSEAHLMAVGFDEQSPAVAQERARQRVAQLVSSTISTQQNSINSVSQINGVESVEKRLEEQAHVTASFEFYNLITDIDAPHRSKGGYRSLACLSLDEWEQEVMQLTQSDRESLQKQARTLVQTSDVFVFGIQQVQFYERLAEMIPTMDTLRAVLNRSSMLEMELNTSVSMVEQHSTKLRQQTPIYMMPSTVPNVVQTRVSQQLHAGGLMVSSGFCTNAQGIEFTLSLDEHVGKGPMGGEVVQKNVHATLRSCQTGEQKTVPVVNAQGYHSNSLELAQKKADANLSTFDLPEQLLWFLPMMY